MSADTATVVLVLCALLVALIIAAEWRADRRAEADHAAAVAKLHADQDRAWRAKANKAAFDSKGSTR